MPQAVTERAHPIPISTTNTSQVTRLLKRKGVSRTRPANASVPPSVLPGKAGRCDCALDKTAPEEIVTVAVLSAGAVVPGVRLEGEKVMLTPAGGLTTERVTGLMVWLPVACESTWMVNTAVCPRATSTTEGVTDKVTDAGVAGAAPVPVRLAVCVPSESVTVSVALNASAVCGAKTTLIEQEAPAANELPHCEVAVKAAAPVPLTETALMGRAAFPEFVSVNVWLPLPDPVVCEPKSQAAGSSVAFGLVATPVPVRPAVTVPT